MGRPGIQTHPGKIKATHRYEVVETVSRPSVVGKRFHFIGAGGVGMSGLARLLLEKKALVTGSDQNAGSATSLLRRMGAEICIGHSAENLSPRTDVVVVSAAVKEDNPELRAARELGCRIYKYAQFLGELLGHFEGIAVSGTHGKSTTSGWLAYCLRKAGVDVNFIVGADIPQLGASSGSGKSEFFVAEACEYDRSFQNLKPKVACILNVERDHLDCYRDEEDIVEAFWQFARGSKPDGLIVANGEDRNTRRVLGRLGDERASLTFGLAPTCNVYARNIREHEGLYRFDVFRDGALLGPARLSLPGRHNIYNALAVIALALSIGLEPERILEGLNGFTGMDRRLMLKGRFGDITVLDDYAHHPTEVRASLQAIRQRYAGRRLWCVYQAHQYSRTRFFLEEFAGSFGRADKVIIPDIYFVRDSQASRKEVNAEVLAARIRAKGTDAEYIGRLDAVCDYLEQHARAGDVVVTMGAGDVWKVADEFIQRLGSHR